MADFIVCTSSRGNFQRNVDVCVATCAGRMVCDSYLSFLGIGAEARKAIRKAICPACSGYGRVKGKRCMKCKGRGRNV